MSNLKISLIGYGKMGRQIENLAVQTFDEKGIEVVSVIDPNYEPVFSRMFCNQPVFKEISEESVKDADVCIDFTTQDVIVDNIKKLLILGKNIVVGTTGWNNESQLGEVRDFVSSYNGGLIYSTNFSVGANLYFALVERLSALSINKGYDMYGVEMHHSEKKDKPSGTARSLENMIFDITGKKIDFASIRAGKITGIHTTGIDSEFDNIEITHSAKNRGGFAYGALLAAEFIKDRKGFYGPKDFMKYLLEERK